MCVIIKTRCFYSFTIISQSKLTAELKTNNLTKRCKPPKNCLTKQETGRKKKKKKALKKEKKKNEMRGGWVKQQQKIFTFPFSYSEKYVVRKHIWKCLVIIATFALQFFRVTGYWKYNNKTPKSMQICIANGHIDM